MGSQIAIMLDIMKKNGAFVKAPRRTEIRKVDSNELSYYNLWLSKIK